MHLRTSVRIRNRELNSHGGQLPTRLDDITDVPIPVDPISGKPFGYRRQGEAALLEGKDGVPGMFLRLEIRLAR